MKNENYNLIKMLHNTLDDLWRLEKYYIRDAKKAKCKSCQKILENMRKDIKKHVNSLTAELGSHIKAKKLK
ncbi:MAG TPA: hypothetical protein ENN28_01370 [Candidatus Uhrbacteria bacterium]|nr:hypothetical protein [Candidatus Uhrbacteria bacterium]